jgi:hypothetical protein
VLDWLLEFLDFKFLWSLLGLLPGLCDVRVVARDLVPHVPLGLLPGGRQLLCSMLSQYRDVLRRSRKQRFILQYWLLVDHGRMLCMRYRLLNVHWVLKHKLHSMQNGIFPFWLELQCLCRELQRLHFYEFYLHSM